MNSPLTARDWRLSTSDCRQTTHADLGKHPTTYFNNLTDWASETWPILFLVVVPGAGTEPLVRVTGV